MTTRENTVAQADPLTPSAGAPKCPKMNTQLQKTLVRFASTSANMIGWTTPMPCR